MDAVVKIVEPKKFIEGKVYCEGPFGLVYQCKARKKVWLHK